MRLKRFLIPSLAAAGLIPQPAIALPAQESERPETGKTSLFEAFSLHHVYNLAQHRSHSSHASHSSHRSSSGGGSRTPVYRAPTPTPTPLYSAPAPSAPAPSVPRSDSTSPSTILPSSPGAAMKTLPGNSDKFLEIARQVQLGLLSWGYYNGAIDGIVGPETRAAISALQTDWNLKVTGTITPEVLDALKILAE